MKHVRSLAGLVLVLLIGCSSSTGKDRGSSITYGGLKREFIVYVPKAYTGTVPVPLVLNLHGYTSNATEQMWYGDFRLLADSANFIIVHPEGTTYKGSTHWNTGGWTPDSTVDDLGFLNALLDHLVATYKIDTNRIYSAGMSNGGEMSYHLACHSSHRIAAIASVGGSMTPETFQSCRPTRPMPVLHIHGTADSVVPYVGDKTATSIENVLAYWDARNLCTRQPTASPVPDINTSDQSTVEHSVCQGEKANTEHFKVIGGDHTWPGSAIEIKGTNRDINASAEIWKFFDRYDLQGPRN